MISLRGLVTRRAADPDEVDQEVPDDAAGRQIVTRAVCERCDVVEHEIQNPARASTPRTGIASPARAVYRRTVSTAMARPLPGTGAVYIAAWVPAA